MIISFVLKRELSNISEQFIYLTTKGRVTGNNHTVGLWFAYGEGKVFISHEGEYTDWMKNIQNNPDVEFKIGSQYNYKLPYDILPNLERLSGTSRIIINNSQEFEDGKYALYEKYYGKDSKEVVDDWFSLSTILVIIPELHSDAKE